MATLGISTQPVSAAYSGTSASASAARRRQDDATQPSGEGSSVRSGDQESRPTGRKELTPEEQRQIASLQQIDRAVRAHEQAHISAGMGVVTSSASFSYTYGPDGKQYAVGGEVGIDTSAEKKPEANIDKGIRIQAAALAPADPSAQDYRVAAMGNQLEAKGRADLARQQGEEGASSKDSARQRVEQAYRGTETKSTFSIFA